MFSDAGNCSIAFIVVFRCIVGASLHLVVAADHRAPVQGVLQSLWAMVTVATYMGVQGVCQLESVISRTF